MTDSSKISALEDARYQATINVDLAVLDSLLADELVFNHSNTAVDSKRSYLDGLASSKWVYKAVQRRNERVDVFGGTARVTGECRLTLRNPDGSDRVTESRYLSIWIERDNRWQFLAWQSTRIPTAESTR